MTDKRILRIVVAGQVPPPVTGQNIMIARILRMLNARSGTGAVLLPFNFTPEMGKARKFSLWKLRALMASYGALFRAWKQGHTRILLFPAGGHHWVPLLRDMLLLPWCYLLFDKVIIHFHAGGIAGLLRRIPALWVWLTQSIYAQAAGAVVMTDFGRSDPEALGIRNMVVVPNALSDTFDPSLISDKLAKQTVTLLNIGLLCPEKGTLALLQAFARLHRSNPEYRLVLAGPVFPPLTTDALERHVQDLGIEDAVEFTGVVEGEEKWRLFARADLFVFPSVAPQETFGLALVEAMMWELPVVVTDWRGNSEVLGPDPGGVVFPPQPDLSDNLAAALDKAVSLQELWAEWGKRNRGYYLSHYNEMTVMPLLETGLRQLVRQEEHQF